MPRIVCRVVCGFGDVIATFVPTSAFVSVDFPTLGRPTKQANPLRCSAGVDVTPDPRTRPRPARVGARTPRTKLIGARTPCANT